MKVAVLGGGQLAAMMAHAGLPMGLDFVFLDPADDACAQRYGPLVVADWTDADRSEAVLECDRITCDFENVPARVLESLDRAAVVRPGPRAFASAQDRLVEKQRLESLGIALSPFAAVSSRPELLEALDRIGYPAVLKTRRLGYDGKGQYVLHGIEDLEPAWSALEGHDLVLEGWVDYAHECALTAVRSAAGEIRFYPPSWTFHSGGILRLAMAPAPVAPALIERAEAMVERLMVDLDYIGCLTLELFVTDDALLANEFAPRVHNSAHWTIEGAVTSQFENHLRAVCDLPLGDTQSHGHALMLNWIGEMPDLKGLLQMPGLSWHDYRKQPRPGRKLGHATLSTDRLETLQGGIERLRGALSPQWSDWLARAGLSLA
jgi:5-(carboxyamino)imidazole ribonucleotide synthase